MKKIVLLLACLMVVLACSAIAEGTPTVYESGDYSYILLEDGTAEITELDFDAKEAYALMEMRIPRKLDGHIVTSIGESAFYDCTVPSEIIIPDSVISIGDFAFRDCSGLTEITIPDSVRFIGSDPFVGCTRLAEIYVSPDHPTLATIDGVLFDKTEKKLLRFPCAYTEESYSIPNGITSIGDYAFRDCSSLKEITIPDTVVSIGTFVFGCCDSLTEIKIPDSVSFIGGDPFYGIETKIILSPDHPVFTIMDGVLIDKTEKKLICCLPGFEAEVYSIPDGVISIGNWAFEERESLKEITIPDGVISIGDGAFGYCYSLKEITIPDSVISIGNYAFEDCCSLTEIILPDSVTSIGDYAFNGCDSLKKVTIPDSVTYIGEYTFEGRYAFEKTFKGILIVDRDSYAAQYAKEEQLKYTYTDALDWLNS